MKLQSHMSCTESGAKGEVCVVQKEKDSPLCFLAGTHAYIEGALFHKCVRWTKSAQFKRISKQKTLARRKEKCS